MEIKRAALVFGLVFVMGAGAVSASNGEPHPAQISDEMSHTGFALENGLAIPAFDADKGRELFASKGCVVCHTVNGIGGEDAPEFNAEWMDSSMNAFEFAANMWRGAGAMIAMQDSELGGQIELDGTELAAIIAFVHSGSEQKKFSQADIPHATEEMMHGMRGHGDAPEAEMHN